jgi:tetratricopeptide (TPR) repeat protein
MLNRTSSASHAIVSMCDKQVETPADTHLNACAVLSQLGRHQAALEHAQSALILLQEELFSGASLSVLSTNGSLPTAGQPPRADRVAVLAIAYHNMGVEQEFLKKFDHSLQSYRKGVEAAQKVPLIQLSTKN